MIPRAKPSGPGPDDEIGIATLYLLTMMVIAVGIRLIFRYSMVRSFQWDDTIICVGLIASIVQSSLVMSAVGKGFGGSPNLPHHRLEEVKTSLYASDLFYALGIGLGKLSLLQFLKKLCVETTLKKACQATFIAVAIWMVPLFFTLAFQCGVTSPSLATPTQCIDKYAFWVAISAFDLLTELVICVLPVFAIIPVQVALAKKVTIVLAFMFRTFVIIATIIRLAFLHSNQGAEVPNLKVTITTQCVLCVSIVTACVPSLKLFLEAFDSGMLNVSLTRHLDKTSASRSRNNGSSYALRSLPAAKNASGTMRSRTMDESKEDEVEELGTSAAAFAVSPPVAAGVTRNSGMVIHRVDHWSVKNEPVERISESNTDDIDSLAGRSRRGQSL